MTGKVEKVSTVNGSDDLQGSNDSYSTSLYFSRSNSTPHDQNTRPNYYYTLDF